MSTWLNHNQQETGCEPVIKNEGVYKIKKILLVVSGFVVAVLVFDVAGFAYAQSQNTLTPEYPHGPGMMGNYDGYGSGYGHGMMGSYNMMDWDGEEGPMHAAMVAAVADALGLTPEEIQDLMFSAHDTALEEAVANGWLTQVQADGMDSHMEGMWEDGSPCGSQNGTGFIPHGAGMNW